MAAWAGGLAHSEIFMEGIVSMLDQTVDDLRNVAEDKVIPSRGRRGFKYRSQYLIKNILVANFLSNNTDIAEVIRLISGTAWIENIDAHKDI